MEVFIIIKRIALQILVGVVILTVFGFLFPTWIFIPGIFTGAILLNQIYTKGGRNFLSLDLSLFIAILLIGGITSLLQVSGCLLLPSVAVCAPNKLRATIFMAISFPLLCGLVLWLVIRLPMVLKSLFKK